MYSYDIVLINLLLYDYMTIWEIRESIVQVIVIYVINGMIVFVFSVLDSVVQYVHPFF